MAIRVDNDSRPAQQSARSRQDRARPTAGRATRIVGRRRLLHCRTRGGILTLIEQPAPRVPKSQFAEECDQQRAFALAE